MLDEIKAASQFLEMFRAAGGGQSRLVLLPIFICAQQASPTISLRRSTVWPECDVCDAWATTIADVFSQQKRPSRLGGGPRNLSEAELEELLDKKVCTAEAFGQYKIGRDGAGALRLVGRGITVPSKGLMGVGLAKGDKKKHNFFAQLEGAVGIRLADSCAEMVAEGGGPLPLYELWGNILSEQAQRGTALWCLPMIIFYA